LANSPITGNASPIDELLDRYPVSSLQVRVGIICALIAMIDGFDTQAVAFVAPILAREWGVAPAAMGLVFAAGLAGIMVGQIVFGPLADRFGRRPVIIWSTVAFGIGSLLTLLSENVTHLLVLRFFTGIGLGGATPNIIALTAEYAPPRFRNTAVTLMFAGFPLGAALGGVLSSYLIPQFGWQTVFWIGGIVPLLLLPILGWGLNESPQYLHHSGRDAARLSAIVERIGGGAIQLPVAIATTQSRLSIARLFDDGRQSFTWWLWLTYLCSLLTIYFLMNWLPTIAEGAGLSIDSAIYSAVALNLGGAIGGVLLGRLADRIGAFRVLTVGYAIAGLCLVGVGVALGAQGIFMMLLFCAGLFTIGGQTALNAAATTLYPAELRATALGSALAVGRVGSIVGPIVGGWLLGSGLPMSGLFFMVAGPALLAAISLAMIQRRMKNGV
jgi:MFS transporter, AAHS family, 4-hydroxybenzoate transporter